jgi:uncharacterized spore protein YtfJ
VKINELLSDARDAITVGRVYGEPFERDGLTVIPAAAVGGGGGGGGGHDKDGQEGEGGGFGIKARPAGAFVIKDGKVSWLPAVDPNRMVIVFGIVAVAYFLTRPRLAGARAQS